MERCRIGVLSLTVLLWLPAAGCEGDTQPTRYDIGVDNAGPPACQTGTFELGPDEGVVFVGCTKMVKGEAHDQKCDLMAYRNGDGLDLKAGTLRGETSLTMRLLHPFKTEGGLYLAYDALADVPDTCPTEADRGAQAILVEGKVGMTVEHNVSPAGCSRVWVESVSPGTTPTLKVHYEVL